MGKIFSNDETVSLRLHEGQVRAGPTLIYLPGLHGDWTLVGAFRAALAGRARFVETCYPRRVDWTLDDFAAGVVEALVARGITEGWLLGESFSSQVAWTILRRHADRAGAFEIEKEKNDVSPFKSGFKPLGLVLVGGFVRHPWPWGVQFARGASRRVPDWLLKRLCAFYAWTAARRHGSNPERQSELQEFVARRIVLEDRAAITSRYKVILENDLRPVARQTRQPVYHLSGALDPIVPWWQVRRWLRGQCPGYRESRILGRAGHNVLLDAAEVCAEQILAWTG